jgi:tetratricopeptide (TPR) repeat protein
MRRALAASILLAGLALSGLARADDWVEIKTEGFTVYGDDGEKAARKVAERLEALRSFLRSEWPWARFAPDLPVVVVALEGEKEFRLLLPMSAANVRLGGITFFQPHRTLVLLHGEVPEDPSEDNPHHAVYHEYIHTVLGRTLRLPTWLSEGLAEYWASTKVKQHEIEFGRPISGHVLTLRTKAWFPLGTLLRVSPSSPVYSETDRASVFYAESWALVHYLALGSPERRGQLNRLVTLIAQGRDDVDASHEVLGDFDALLREVRTSVGGRGMPYSKRARPPVEEAARGAARHLSKAEVLELRGGVLLAARRPGEGRQLVEEALKLDPGLVGAKEAMGIAAFTAGDAQTTREWLEPAAASGRAGFFTQYALGLMAAGEKGEEASARAEARLREAIRLNPQFASARTALAAVLADRGGPRAEALQLVDQATKLDQGAVVSLSAATVLWRLGEPELAKLYARNAVRQAPTSQFGSKAAELVRFLESAPASNAPKP